MDLDPVPVQQQEQDMLLHHVAVAVVAARLLLWASVECEEVRKAIPPLGPRTRLHLGTAHLGGLYYSIHINKCNPPKYTTLHRYAREREREREREERRRRRRRRTLRISTGME